MNYGNLVKRPFEIVARRPYLWLLGLLAGGATGLNLPSTGTRYTEPAPGAYAPSWAGLQAVWTDYWGWIVGILAAAALVAIIVFILGCIATGAIIHAAVEHDAGREYRLRTAWRAGYATGWRIAGLRILTFLLAAAPGLLAGALGLAAAVQAEQSIPAAVAFGLLAAAVLLASFVFWLLLGLAFQLAARLIVLEGGHVAESLTAGFRMIRWHPKEVGVGWVILVALTIAAGIVLGIAAAVIALPAVALGFAGWMAAGWTGTVITGSFAAVFFLGIVVAAAGAISAYTSVYWTLLFGGLRALPTPAPRGAFLPAG